MRKFESVEWLRGLASLGIAVMHLFNATNYFNADDLFFKEYIAPLTLIGRVGVPIFFVISGFIIPYSMWVNDYSFPKKWSNFILRRFTRIEPPYLLSILLSLVVLLIVYKGSYKIDWLNVLGHIGYLNIFNGKGWIQGVYWTLAVEFQYYLFISIFFSLLVKGTEFRKIIILFLILISTYFLWKYLNNEAFIFRHIPLFVVGILVFLQIIGKISKQTMYGLGLIVLSLIFYDFGKIYFISALFTAICIYINLDCKVQPLYFLGKISYSLYLLHWPIGVEIGMKTIAIFFPNAGSSTKIIISISALLLAVVVSYIYFLLIEKPAIRWSKKLK